MTDHSHHHASAPVTGQLAIDPVCGMSVDPATSTLKADHGGDNLLFLRTFLPDKVHRQSGEVS